ncbi:hypothetical protein BOTBODRAFT_215075 [Botryobasidium botryosum FD-172 SS1]|uniref:Uncharacterized protein n=1 Tax=Botryobasidium botryosum (strain FD-172 SS1) TaxID=930990 RepID=A0A067N204_BOTB1|nr:hypothetical protein BOTBODRAFT_215075 [Botryobasidium botryosum FD-172 SS1]
MNPILKPTASRVFVVICALLLASTFVALMQVRASLGISAYQARIARVALKGGCCQSCLASYSKYCRPFSTSRAALSVTGLTSSIPLSRRVAVRNLLRSTDDLVKRTLQDSSGSVKWLERVQHALVDLERLRMPRLSVWGVDSLDARDLVTVLLDDPLSSDDVRRHMLFDRHGSDRRAKVFHLRYEDDNRLDGNVLYLSSPWLGNAQVEIVEFSGS